MSAPEESEPVVIYWDTPEPLVVDVQPEVVIETPPQLGVKSTHQVPWNYDPVKVLIDGKVMPEPQVNESGGPVWKVLHARRACQK